MNVPDFAPLMKALDFAPLTVAVMSAFVLLAGFGVVVCAGIGILDALGLRVGHDTDERIMKMDAEEFKDYAAEMDKQERKERRKRWKDKGLL